MTMQYFIHRNDYFYARHSAPGLSGKKHLAAPKNGQGAAYIIKSGDLACACIEFMALQLAKRIGANVPDARLVVPKENGYEVAIEYLAPEPKPDMLRLRSDPSLLHAYVFSVLVHALFEDRDRIDWLISGGKLYTLDFAEGFCISNFAIQVMEQEKRAKELAPKDWVDQLIAGSINYRPDMQYAHQFLVAEQGICSKAYFDSALAEIRARFLAIPDDEIRSLLDALSAIYPAGVAAHFERYIAEIQEFCRA